MPRKQRAIRQPLAADVRASDPTPTLHVTDEPPNEHSASSPSEKVDTSTNAGSGGGAAAPELASFGAYTLLWEICRDALSITYACEREGVSTPLAIRIFNDRLNDEIQVRQIQRAAKIAADLTHANIITVYESGVLDGAPYVVSDWAEAHSLADVIASEKRLDIGRFLTVFQQIIDALIEAHSRQLLHKNLSPEKIILMQDAEGRETVKIKDFGMPPDPAKNAFYMSNEQYIDALRIDARADIYSLGCMMYEALLGTAPFVGHSAKQASLDVLHDLANRFSPESAEHKALKLLDCIIAKCLQRQPSKRFGSVQELSSALSLVNDCLLHGSSKRLPAKAEKLLLFRFLDIFDKKIVACVFAYMVFGLLCTKYIGEWQLQKNIDDAQVATMAGDTGKAGDRWNAALSAATLMRKPASMLAELHFELGDNYCRQLLTAKNKSARSEISKKAMAEYRQALSYYGRGTHFRPLSTILHQSVGALWTEVDRPSPSALPLQKTLLEADKLYRGRKFKECAELCSRYLEREHDATLCNLAACSYNELALAQPDAKAIPLFMRAQSYMHRTRQYWENSIITNARDSIIAVGGDPDSPNTYLNLFRDALARGDIDGAHGALCLQLIGRPFELLDAVHNYRVAQRDLTKAEISPASAKKAAEAWERSLKLEEAQYGENNRNLSFTLSSLAYCYRLAGDDKKSRAMLERYFQVADLHSGDVRNVSNALYYLELLNKAGQKQKAISFLNKLLENREITESGFSKDVLRISLIRLYMQTGQRNLANILIDQIVAERQL